MGDVPAGLIEVGLVFGAVIAWAIWEVLRTRRALARPDPLPPDPDRHDGSGGGKGDGVLR